MSRGYEEIGRVRQKQRTRDALIAAAREIVANGLVPTVESAAERACISRTTAYRYFENQAALVAAAHPETTALSLLPENPPVDARQRLELVVGRVVDMVRDTEAQQRTMLRLSLDPSRAGTDGLLLRQGRVIPWLVEALDPLAAEVGAVAVDTLAVAIRSVIGIEAYVWLRDVARLSAEDAGAVMRWNARALFDTATNGSPPPVVKR